MQNLRHPLLPGAFDNEDAETVAHAYMTALHTVAPRPAFFSDMNPEDIRRHLAARIISDVQAGVSDVSRLSATAVQAVESVIRSLNGVERRDASSGRARWS